jgi:prevent-host-death family protein
MKRHIGAREANQHFSALIKQIEDEDVTVVITRRGRPVVQMQRAETDRDPDEVASRMDALFEKYSRPIGFTGIDRDALHERDGSEKP